MTLPVSGTTMTIEAWKPVASAVDLAARIADIGGWLTANETSTGPYLHGSRFVAFLHVGGMEYDGGTTTSVSPLRHETFHSWWGRGLKPASQADGWWDEAWDVYNDDGASGASPLDFTDPPVELSSRNPWVRRTPSESYSSGEAFFEGAAALVGVAGLTSQMAAFYESVHARPATTAALEEFLVSRTGEATLVDAFHRFVYGFGDPVPPPDLWLKDDPGHPGGNLWAGTFWNSPDLWIRHADDGGTTHQPVEYGQDNWFHARVRNRSTTAVARHFVVTFNVKPWAGTEFVYPADFLPCIAAAAGFELGPGASTIVKARWPAALVPRAGTHACWLAAVLTRSDRPGSGPHVWEHNNLAQKNLTVADVVPGDWFVLPFVLDRLPLRRRRRIALELVRPRGWARLEAAVLHTTAEVFEMRSRPASELGIEVPREAAPETRQGLLECGGMAGPRGPARDSGKTLRGVKFPAGRAGRVPVLLPGRGPLVMRLALRAPAAARPGDVVPVDLVQVDHKRQRATGGLAIGLRIRKGRP